MQYFERAVFEYHPENQPPYDVLLSLLGDFYYKKNHSGFAPKPGWVAAQVEEIKGDTIKVDVDGDSYPVKFMGINMLENAVPEILPKCQDNGLAAIKALIPVSSTVYLEEASNWDRDGSLWRYVFTPKAFVNAELVLHGDAVADNSQPDSIADYQALLTDLNNDGTVTHTRQTIIEGCKPPTPTPLPTSTPLPTRTPRPTPALPPTQAP